MFRLFIGSTGIEKKNSIECSNIPNRKSILNSVDIQRCDLLLRVRVRVGIRVRVRSWVRVRVRVMTNVGTTSRRNIDMAPQI